MALAFLGSPWTLSVRRQQLVRNSEVDRRLEVEKKCLSSLVVWRRYRRELGNDQSVQMLQMHKVQHWARRSGTSDYKTETRDIQYHYKSGLSELFRDGWLLWVRIAAVNWQAGISNRDDRTISGGEGGARTELTLTTFLRERRRHTLNFTESPDNEWRRRPSDR